jgi:hypothetical protein
MVRLLSGRVSYHFSTSAATLLGLIFAFFGSTCYSWKSSSENLGSGVHFEACTGGTGGTVCLCPGNMQDLGIGRFDSEPQPWYGLLKLMQLSRYFKYRWRYSTSLPWSGTALFIVSNGYTACDELCSRTFSCSPRQCKYVCLLSAVPYKPMLSVQPEAMLHITCSVSATGTLNFNGGVSDLTSVPKLLKYSYV